MSQYEIYVSADVDRYQDHRRYHEPITEGIAAADKPVLVVQNTSEDHYENQAHHGAENCSTLWGPRQWHHCASACGGICCWQASDYWNYGGEGDTDRRVNSAEVIPGEARCGAYMRCSTPILRPVVDVQNFDSRVLDAVDHDVRQRSQD